MKTLKGWGPTDRSLLVLTSLAGGPKHGYALIKDVEDFSGVRLGPGTLYGCLSKLEAAGLIEALPADDRRHPYQATATGLRVLRDELDKSVHIAQVGLARLALGVQS
jgi:DNA-binding PadR family transcriptional regulator